MNPCTTVIARWWSIGDSNSWALHGKRIRQNFKDKADGRRLLGDLELEIAGAPEPRQTLRTHLSSEELADAETATQRLKGMSHSLSQVVAHYLNVQSRVVAKGVDLDQAISFFETRYRPETKAITVLNAKNEFLATRHGIADATKANYEIGLQLLLKPDPNRFVHLFTIGDLETTLKKYANLRSQRSFRTIFSVFFHWAVRHHYCLENPCDRFDKLPKDESQIAALSLEEAKRLLYAATQLQDGAAAAVVAIGLFVGLRPSEIRDLTTEDILKDKIRVSRGKMRRKLKRTVPLPPVLAAWLEKYPFSGLPPGWNYKMKALKQATKAKRWVQDIIRHTSLSFQTERDKDEAKTAFHNSTSIQMLNLHCRHTIDDEKIIDEFWNLTPAKLLPKEILAKWAGKLRSQPMISPPKSPDPATLRCGPGIFLPKHRPPTHRNTSCSPLFPHNPHLPALRSSHELSQRPAPQKQFPSSQPIQFPHSWIRKESRPHPCHRQGPSDARA